MTIGKALSKMVYGIVCFATLFSFVGTVLGGIWADQSWGRFWGWDPKENGALLIVLWNAIILHARWGGLARDRGIMNLAVFGNIVTSFSWFGVNMLGIGLHSYGFMDAAFKWLMLFMASQLVDHRRGPAAPAPVAQLPHHGKAPALRLPATFRHTAAGAGVASGQSIAAHSRGLAACPERACPQAQHPPDNGSYRPASRGPLPRLAGAAPEDRRAPVTENAVVHLTAPNP